MPKRKTDAEKIRDKLEQCMEIARRICAEHFDSCENCPLSAGNENCEKIEIDCALSVVKKRIELQVLRDSNIMKNW